MQFLSTVCMAAIASALFRLLVPENRFAKQISLLITGLFLLAGINAVKGADLSFDKTQYSYEDNADYIGFSGDINRDLQKKICSDMSDKLFSLLNSNEIYPGEIHVIVNISGLYSISITQVELVFEESRRPEAAAAEELLSRELPPEIKVKVIIKE
ncbi:MAG: hypothetical protein ACI4WS_10805 [Oscillospiraceae bacterium]